MRLPICVLLILAGCAARPPRTAVPFPPEQVPTYAAAYGEAQACSADLKMQVRRTDADNLNFSIILWISADDHLRASLSKLGKPFLNLLITPDGAFRATLALDDVAIDSDLDQLAAAAQAIDAERADRGQGRIAEQQLNLLEDLRLLLDEIKRGPVPQAPHYTTSSRALDGFECTMRNGQIAVFRMSFQGRGTIVTDKTIYAADHTELATITYRSYDRLDGVLRPQRLELQIPEDTNEYHIGLKAIDVVPAISRSRLELTIPAHFEILDARPFIEFLIADDDDSETR